MAKGLCRRCYSNAWRTATPERRRAASEANKAWQRNNPERAKVHSDRSNAKRQKRYASDPEYRLFRAFCGLLNRYGVTREEYERVLAQQGGRCGICRSDKPGRRRRLFAMDHDHNTGVFRGLLCIYCNTALGAFRDSVFNLAAAIAYLENRR